MIDNFIFALIPSATILNASISNPESVSSKIANFGSMLHLKNFILFFSPPENQHLIV